MHPDNLLVPYIKISVICSRAHTHTNCTVNGVGLYLAWMFYAKVFAPRDVDEDCEKEKKKKLAKRTISYPSFLLPYAHVDGGSGGRTYVAPYLIISFLLYGTTASSTTKANGWVRMIFLFSTLIGFITAWAVAHVSRTVFQKQLKDDLRKMRSSPRWLSSSFYEKNVSNGFLFNILLKIPQFKLHKISKQQTQAAS